MRRPGSLRRRLLTALMLMTILTVVVAGGLSAAMDLKLFRDQVQRDLSVLAEVVGENCVAALVFDSPESAERNLATLAREYQIRAATLYDADGRPFAVWRAAADTDAPGGARRLRIDHRLMFDGRPIGRLALEVRLDELARQTRVYVRLGVGVALLTLGLALLVALRLQRRIAGPILALVQATRAITAREDFTLRVPAPTADREIDTLVRDFNGMLAHIEQREAALDAANAELRRLAADLALLPENERARLAAELHDGPMQRLALAQLQLDVGLVDAMRGGTLAAEARERIGLGVALLREAIGELRRLQFELSPPVLHQRGLAAALDWLAADTRARFGIALAAVIDADLPALDRRASMLLFQCARELVHNLIRHAGARRGLLRLGADADGLTLRVEDDGRGFCPARVAAHDAGSDGGYGLYSVRERLGLLGGTMTIESGADGTRIRLRLPLAALAPAPAPAPALAPAISPAGASADP